MKARDAHALWHLWAWMHRRGANVTQEGFDKLMPCIIYGIERRWIESSSMSLDGVDAEENQRLLLRWALTDEGNAAMHAYNQERLKEEDDV